MILKDLWDYVCRLFENYILVYFSLVFSIVVKWLFPSEEYLVASRAVLGIIILDLITKLYSLTRQSRSFREAIREKRINSKAFTKGTIDKLIVFGVMLIICSLLYNVAIVSEIAIWFTQVTFTLMFFKDVLSILENLDDAGIEVGVFKYVVRKKMESYLPDEEIKKLERNDEDEREISP